MSAHTNTTATTTTTTTTTVTDTDILLAQYQQMMMDAEKLRRNEASLTASQTLYLEKKLTGLSDVTKERFQKKLNTQQQRRRTEPIGPQFDKWFGKKQQPNDTVAFYVLADGNQRESKLSDDPMTYEGEPTMHTIHSSIQSPGRLTPTLTTHAERCHPRSHCPCRGGLKNARQEVETMVLAANATAEVHVGSKMQGSFLILKSKEDNKKNNVSSGVSSGVSSESGSGSSESNILDGTSIRVLKIDGTSPSELHSNGGHQIQSTKPTAVDVMPSHPLPANQSNRHGAHVNLWNEEDQKIDGVGLVIVCDRHNTGKSPFVHQCKAIRILDFSGTDPSKYYALGEVVGRMRNGRSTTIQQLTLLRHYEKTETKEAYTRAEGWGFSPLQKHKKNDGSVTMVKVSVYTKDKQRFIFTFLKKRFCYLQGTERQRRSAPATSHSRFEPVCLRMNDDHLYSDSKGGTYTPWGMHTYMSSSGSSTNKESLKVNGDGAGEEEEEEEIEDDGELRNADTDWSEFFVGEEIDDENGMEGNGDGQQGKFYFFKE